jgi:hypothetical protein
VLKAYLKPSVVVVRAGGVAAAARGGAGRLFHGVVPAGMSRERSAAERRSKVHPAHGYARRQPRRRKKSQPGLALSPPPLR